MKNIKRRYTTPATPPPLGTRPATAQPGSGHAPILSFRRELTYGRAIPGMVTFGWGAVVLPNSRR